MERIFSLVWFQIFPARFGGQKGIADFYQALSIHFQIDCLCSTANSKPGTQNLQVLSELPTGKWQFLNPFVWRNIIRKFNCKRYQYLLIEFPYYGFIGYLLKQRVVYILHMHNIESQRFLALGKWWWPLLQVYERWSLQQAHLVLFKTEKDKHFAVHHFKIKEERCYLLPYGIGQNISLDKQQSRLFLEHTYGINPGELILLFAGTLDYSPNAEAVTALYHQVAPLLCQHLHNQFRIIICGRNEKKEFAYLKAYQHENVTQAGMVEEIDVYFSGADVFINPVQKTFGVQTKIIDAIWSGLSVVAFEDAGVGLPSYLLNRKLFVSPTTKYCDFVLKIKEAVTVKQKTPELFYEEFSWTSIVSNFTERMKSVRV